MCRVLGVHRSGYYRDLQQPLSARAKEDQRLSGLIKQSWLKSGGVYGSPRSHMDMKSLGESCSRHRVARLMKAANIAAVLGYKRRPFKSTKPAHVAPNHLQQVFRAEKMNQCWVSDITYIRTHEGWLY